ncbi:hypothetical protein Tco_0712848 [Tanacetum coccineum]
MTDGKMAGNTPITCSGLVYCFRVLRRGLSEKVLFSSGLSYRTILFSSGLSYCDSSLSYCDNGLFTKLDYSGLARWQRFDNLPANWENILQSIDEGPFKMGKFRETLADSALGPERDRVVKDLTPEEKERYKADIRATNILLQVKLNRGLKTSNYDQLYAYLKQNEAHANENKMMLERYTQHAIDPLAFMSNVLLQQYPTQSSAIL